MQQPPQMAPLMPSFSANNITTEQIQKYLDENKKLILAILDNQNLGKLAECAQYQAQLQKNLMYLAAIADAQPQTTPSMPPQMAPHPAMQPGGYFMQHPQAAAMAQQAGFSPKRRHCNLIAHIKCRIHSSINKPCKVKWELDLEGPIMACIQCILRLLLEVEAVVVPLQLRAKMMHVVETSKRALKLVLMDRAAQLVVMEQRRQSDCWNQLYTGEWV